MINCTNQKVIYYFSILSFNAQSINAKFDEFQIAINQINNIHEVSIICIQESWLSSDSDTSLFDIPNYQLVAKGKYCSNHGGLLIYVYIKIFIGRTSQYTMTLLYGKTYLLKLDVRLQGRKHK